VDGEGQLCWLLAISLRDAVHGSTVSVATDRQCQVELDKLESAIV
jgi:hypothetical protein